MQNLGIFYDHLVYFTSIGNILWPFGIFCGNLVYFVVIWYILPVLVFWSKTNLATLITGAKEMGVIAGITEPLKKSCFLFLHPPKLALASAVRVNRRIGFPTKTDKRFDRHFIGEYYIFA
jgi:hypothetical protein